MPFRRMTYFTVHMPCGNNGGFIFRNQCYGLVCICNFERYSIYFKYLYLAQLNAIFNIY